MAIELRNPKNKRFIDLTGKTFGTLTVKSFMGFKKPIGCSKWICECQCGRTFEAWGNALRAGQCTNCGCKRREKVATKHPLYSTWAGMIERCYDPKCKQYKNYGGRGITVHDGWRKSFWSFAEYMGQKPSGFYSVDRFPDNNGNYEPGNVRWATKQEQNRNRRSNHLVTLDGLTKTLAEWADEFGISRQAMLQRVQSGRSLHGHRQPNSRPKKGENEPEISFSERRERRRTIYEQVAAGATVEIAAKSHGVSVSLVRSAVREFRSTP